LGSPAHCGRKTCWCPPIATTARCFGAGSSLTRFCCFGAGTSEAIVSPDRFTIFRFAFLLDLKQAGRTYRLGALYATPRNDAVVPVFFEAMRRMGFIEGQNVTVDYRDAYAQHIEKLSEWAAGHRAVARCSTSTARAALPRCQGRRRPDRAADQVRTGDQPQDCECHGRQGAAVPLIEG
jgi:hypothetical protein